MLSSHGRTKGTKGVQESRYETSPALPSRKTNESRTRIESKQADDEAVHTAFRERVVTALLAWANLLERVLQENNAQTLRKSYSLSIEEIYFRMSVAINETLLDYLMGEQISMI